jgi:Domain of unknown function (DUF4326)
VTRRVKVIGDLFHGEVPDGALYVGRAAPGLKQSTWHNPFKVADYGLNESLELYRGWVTDNDYPPTIEAIRQELGGRDLACWCSLDRPCHADILLELANPVS